MESATSIAPSLSDSDAQPVQAAKPIVYRVKLGADPVGWLMTVEELGAFLVKGCEGRSSMLRIDREDS